MCKSSVTRNGSEKNSFFNQVSDRLPRRAAFDKFAKLRPQVVAYGLRERGIEQDSLALPRVGNKISASRRGLVLAVFLQIFRRPVRSLPTVHSCVSLIPFSRRKARRGLWLAA